jgi:hypothetical protein
LEESLAIPISTPSTVAPTTAAIETLSVLSTATTNARRKLSDVV